MKKVLFIDSVHDILKARLTAAGYECELHYKTPREKILEILPGYFGIVIRSRISIDRELILAAPNLKFIARSGSGLENIDVAFAQSQGIHVINSPEGNRDAVGEHSVAMLLMLLNNLRQADHDVRAGKWPREENRGREIAGKTIGLIGYGLMGSGFAEKLSGFRANVLAHDKYKTGFSDAYAREAELEEIYETCDIVSLHLPLTEETLYYADDAFFANFRKPIVFINTARGKNTNTSALVKAMKAGKVSGACLDVIEYEKLSLEGLENNKDTEAMRYLISSPHVVLSPHIAGWTHESYFKLSDVLADKILKEFGSA